MTADPYGLMASGLPPEIAARARGLTREQAVAEAMLAQSQKPLDINRMAGGYVIPVSPWEGLAKLGQGYFGRKGLDAADKRMSDLGNEYQNITASEVARYMAKKTGTPASSETIMDEQANGGEGAQATINAPAVTANPRAAVMEAMTSRNPMLQKLGGMDYAEMKKPPEKYDAGDRWILMQDGVKVGEIPKAATPDAKLKEEGSNARHATASGSAILTDQGADRRHITPSGSAQLGAQTTLQTHATPSGSAILGANTTLQTHATPSGSAKLNAETQRAAQAQAVDPVVQERLAAAKASGSATGEARAQAAITLPTAVAKAEQSIALVDQMVGTADGKNKPHPGFSAVVGGTLVPGQRLIHGTPAANFDALFNQVKGGAFLEAFNSLKGAGAITDVEGKKGTEAITRMSTAQSEAEFIKAAREYQDVVSAGIGRMRQRATTPSAGAVLRFDAAGNPVQ